MKHFELKRLFIQDVVKSGELQLVKVGTASNPADVLTKMLSGPQIRRCMQMLPGLSHDDWPEDKVQQDADVQELNVFLVIVEQELVWASAYQRVVVQTPEEGLSQQQQGWTNTAVLMILVVENFLVYMLYITVCKRKVRRVAVQGRTTYTEIRGAQRPRFTPLTEKDVGVFVDCR